MTQEIKEYEGGMKVYVDFKMIDEKVKIENISICISLYGVDVDITDDVMYYINKPQNSKHKRLMLTSIIESIIEEQDNPTDIIY
jgi:hypothetical protein